MALNLFEQYIIFVIAARLYWFFTSTTYEYNKYQYHISELTWIAFQVMTCNDAHIGLFDSYMMQDTYMYEVVLGGYTNTRSSIRRVRYGEDKVSVRLPFGGSMSNTQLG